MVVVSEDRLEENVKMTSSKVVQVLQTAVVSEDGSKKMQAVISHEHISLCQLTLKDTLGHIAKVVKD
jgi:hypothetical protein